MEAMTINSIVWSKGATLIIGSLGNWSKPKVLFPAGTEARSLSVEQSDELEETIAPKMEIGAVSAPIGTEFCRNNLVKRV